MINGKYTISIDDIKIPVKIWILITWDAKKNKFITIKTK